MPVLLGISCGELGNLPGVDLSPHPLGVSLTIKNRELIGELWRRFYPHWLISSHNTADVLVKKYARKNFTLALAESCTGGGIASAITDISGASGVFSGGAVAYSPWAKSSILGINSLPPGCVDSILTAEMASMVKSILGTTIGLGITGALGPLSPAEHIGVGEVYIAVQGFGQQEVRQFNFDGDRHTIKRAAIDAALNFLLTFSARWYIA